jgi:hypothetical protein
MKKTIVAALMLALLAGCTTKTQYGECIGAFEDKKPGVEYKLSALNLALAIVFSETIVVPIVVIADETRCPVGITK